MLKNVASIQIQKVVTFNSDRKIINLIPKNHSDITTNRNRLFFDAFVYSEYFKIFLILEKKYFVGAGF